MLDNSLDRRPALKRRGLYIGIPPHSNTQSGYDVNGKMTHSLKIQPVIYDRLYGINPREENSAELHILRTFW
jgi:hypothetical protein